MKTHPVLFAFMLLAGLTSGSAFAQNLSPVFGLDTAETLPRHVGSPRLINVLSSGSAKFTGQGQPEGLGAQLNKMVFWRDVIREQENDYDRVKLRGALLDNGIDESGTPGSTAGEVNTYANVRVAALAWGMSDRWTVAAALPIVQIEVNASTGYAPNSQVRSIARSIGSDSSPAKAQEVIDKFDNAINRKLARLGYETIPSSQTIRSVGDLQIINKFKIYGNGFHTVALKGIALLPTGVAPDPDKALDIPTGTGRFGAALGVVQDVQIADGTRWTHALTYTAHLPRHEVRRIPTSVADLLSADKEEMYERTRHQLAYTMGADQRIDPIGVTLGAGYSLQYLTRADYESGTTFDESRYYLLGDTRPMQMLHSALFSASFSTIDWFKKKRFPVPFQVNVSYAHPVLGRNAPLAGLFAGELVAFF